VNAHRVVAIDGPAASGKSSVARELARRLGFVYVNTGAMYRAVTWLAVKQDVDAADAGAAIRLLDRADIRFDVASDGTPRESTMRIDGIDPAPFLSESEVNAWVSKIAAIPEVRRRLVARQREYAIDNDVVMEGRDIGTVVFPDTPFKFYIDASPDGSRVQGRPRRAGSDRLLARGRAADSGQRRDGYR